MLSLCRFCGKISLRRDDWECPPLALWASLEEKIFLFWIPKSLRTFRNPFFTERGRDRKWQLQDLFLHFGKSIMIVIDAASRCDPPVKRPIGKIRRFSRLANINNLSAENAQSAAEGILNRTAPRALTPTASRGTGPRRSCGQWPPPPKAYPPGR